MPVCDGDQSITVIREADMPEIEEELGKNQKRWSAGKLAPWTIPMNLRKGLKYYEWEKAGLRATLEYMTADHRKKTCSGCRVMALGIADYYHNINTTRKAILDVRNKLYVYDRYRKLQQVFPNRFQLTNREQKPQTDSKPKRANKSPAKPACNVDELQASSWYKLSTGRGRIADNLVNGRSWYENLFVPMPWEPNS